LKTVYGEGIYVGYRHYERSKIAPLFPFGHGLTYTTFEYGTPTSDSTTLSETEDITITVPVKNTGSFAAHEIVQAYVKDIKSTLPRPEKELQAFGKVFLQPGETQNVTLKLNKYSVGYFDTSLGQTGAWIAEEGAFEVLVGASSADIRYVFPLIYNSMMMVLMIFLGARLASRSRSRSNGFSKKFKGYCVHRVCETWRIGSWVGCLCGLGFSI
jgi:beta-glucosidase